MKYIEIPYVHERGRRYRLFEILPGFLSWSILLFPFVLSLINPHAAAFFIIAYLLLWFVKAVVLNIRAVQGYRILQQHQKLPWHTLLAELQLGKVSQPERSIPSWHYETVRRLQETPPKVLPDDMTHAIIIATYNEAREVLEPTIQTVMASQYDMKKVILVLAYEERGGQTVATNAKELIDKYRPQFKHAMAVMHAKDITGEVIGKGGNITHAGRELAKYLAGKKINPENVIVTTLDADNRPHDNIYLR